MTKVKILKYNDSVINAWIESMEKSAKISTDGNVSFVIQDIKVTTNVLGGDIEGTALIIYRHDPA